MGHKRTKSRVGMSKIAVGKSYKPYNNSETKGRRTRNTKIGQNEAGFM